MLEGLDEVVLAVRDLADAERRTARLLGRSPVWRGEDPGRGVADALFRLGETGLRLVAPSGPGHAALESWLAVRGEGPVALVFRTGDADACRETLARRGLEPAAPEPGLSRDVDSGAFRAWRLVALAPSRTRGVALFAIEHTGADPLGEPPAGPAPAAVEALDHAVIRTPAPEAARALYGERLGLRLALDREFPQWGARLIFFRLGGVTLELAAPPGRGADAPATGVGNDRLWGLSYRVPDADAARARLDAAELDVSTVREGRRPGTRVFSVRGGTGGVPTLMLEVTSRRAP